MPEILAGSRSDIARKTVLFAAENFDSYEDRSIRQLRGVPVLYRYLLLGEDWVVLMSAFGSQIEFRAVHRTELKISNACSTLQELMDDIKNEFGVAYIPDLADIRVATAEDHEAEHKRWFPEGHVNALTRFLEESKLGVWGEEPDEPFFTTTIN